MLAKLNFGNSVTSGNLGVEHFQPYLAVSNELCISFSCISSNSSVQVSGRTCNRSNKISGSHFTLVDGGSLAFHCSQHEGKHSLLVIHGRRSCQGCVGRPGQEGSANTAFNPLAAQRHVAQAKVLFISLSGSGWVNQIPTIAVYQVGVLKRVYQAVPFLLLN